MYAIRFNINTHDFEILNLKEKVNMHYFHVLSKTVKDYILNKIMELNGVLIITEDGMEYQFKDLKNAKEMLDWINSILIMRNLTQSN